MDGRSHIPPRREAIIQQYTAAHEEACLARDEAEKVQGWAEAANDRRDFQGASHFWERSHRATGACMRHREAELQLRKEEYALYNHLDDENEREGLFKLIQYSERRIERLHSEMSKRLVKSRISFLKEHLYRHEAKARLIEKQIIEEDLHNKAKGRSSIAFGTGWDDVGDGWGQRLPEKKGVRQNVQVQAHSRLRFLEGRKKYSLQQIQQGAEEIRQHEAEWEAIREEERNRDAEWARLDAEARRHWAGLPVRQYEAEAYKALEQRKKEEAEALRKKEDEEKARAEQQRQQRNEQRKKVEEQQRKKVEEQQREEEAKRKAEMEAKKQQAEQEELERKLAKEKKDQESKETELERQSQAEEQARWEEEYALEEDPDFAWQPTAQAPQPKPEVVPTLEATDLVSTTEVAGPVENAVEEVISAPDIVMEEYKERGWDADFNKALSEGNNDFRNGISTENEIDESIFDEFLEQSAFKEHDDADNPPI